MTNDKPYNKYKPSGIACLGEIPEHWEVRRAKRIFTERSEKGYENEPFLAATQNKRSAAQYKNLTKRLHLSFTLNLSKLWGTP